MLYRLFRPSRRTSARASARVLFIRVSPCSVRSWGSPVGSVPSQGGPGSPLAAVPRIADRWLRPAVTAVRVRSVAVLGGAMAVLGGAMAVLGGAMAVLGGAMAVLGGAMVVLGGDGEERLLQAEAGDLDLARPVAGVEERVQGAVRIRRLDLHQVVPDLHVDQGRQAEDERL